MEELNGIHRQGRLTRERGSPHGQDKSPDEDLRRLPGVGHCAEIAVKQNRKETQGRA